MQIPRVELEEMGPSMNLALRRLRPAGADVEREAMARPKSIKKKVIAPILCTLLFHLESMAFKVLEPCDVTITLEISSPCKGWRQRLFRHLPEGFRQCILFAMSAWRLACGRLDAVMISLHISDTSCMRA